MEQLLQNTGLLVILVSGMTQVLKWAFPKIKPSLLAKLTCFFIVGIYTLSEYVLSPETVEYAVTQLILVYVTSTKLYDIFINKSR